MKMVVLEVSVDEQLEKVQPTVNICKSVEADFAKQLAGNDPETRNEAVKNVKNYMIDKSKMAEMGFQNNEMIRIWKGLFYCMWMSDKPLTQEALAKKIAGILSCLKNPNDQRLYFEAFVITMGREWHGIDRLRLDKFLLLCRFMLEKILHFLKKSSWEDDLVKWFLTVLRNGLFAPHNYRSVIIESLPIGLRLHFLDIILQEITNCGHNSLSAEQVTSFLKPICELACTTHVKSLHENAVKVILSSIDQSEPVLKAVSPDIELDQVKRLKYNYSEIADYLLASINGKEKVEKNRAEVSRLISKLRDVADGRIPLEGLPQFSGENRTLKELIEEKTDEAAQILYEQMLSLKKAKRSGSRRKRRQTAGKSKTQLSSEEVLFNNEEFKDINFDSIVQESRDDDDDDDNENAPKKKRKSNKTEKAIQKSSSNAINSNEETEHVEPDELITIETDSIESNRNVKEMMEDLVVEPCEPSCCSGSQSCNEPSMDESKEPSVDDLDAFSLALKKRFSKRLIKKKKANRSMRKKLLSELLNSSNAEGEDDAESIPRKSQRCDEEVSNETPMTPRSRSTRKKVATTTSPQALEIPEDMKTPKRVSFQLSKTQIQPFRKQDRSCVLSPSPATVPFDPNRTPDFGLLKQNSPVHGTPTAMKRKRRAKAM